MAVAVKNAWSRSFLLPIERARRISQVRTACATVPSTPARVAYSFRNSGDTFRIRASLRAWELASSGRSMRTFAAMGVHCA